MPDLPCLGGGGAQNDTHVALIILTTQMWGGGGDYWWKKLFQAKICVPAPSGPTSVLTQNKGPDTEPHFSNPPILRRASMPPPPPPHPQSNFQVALCAHTYTHTHTRTHTHTHTYTHAYTHTHTHTHTTQHTAPHPPHPHTHTSTSTFTNRPLYRSKALTAIRPHIPVNSILNQSSPIVLGLFRYTHICTHTTPKPTPTLQHTTCLH